MPYHKFGDNLHKMGEKVIEYGEYRLDFYKLLLYKTIIKMVRSIFMFFLLGAVLLLIFIFASFGLSILIGEALGNSAYGFLIMGGFFLLTLFFLLVFGKRLLEKQIFKITSEWFMDELEKKKGDRL